MNLQRTLKIQAAALGLELELVVTETEPWAQDLMATKPMVQGLQVRCAVLSGLTTVCALAPGFCHQLPGILSRTADLSGHSRPL